MILTESLQSALADRVAKLHWLIHGGNHCFLSLIDGKISQPNTIFDLLQTYDPFGNGDWANHAQGGTSITVSTS